MDSKSGEQKDAFAANRRMDVLWGFFLVTLSLVFFVVFAINLAGMMRLRDCFVETEGNILAGRPVNIVTLDGQTQQVYMCRVAYDTFRVDEAVCWPDAVDSNGHIHVVYDKRHPLSPLCGGRRPSIFRTIRMYSKSYFWILVGWLSPSFLVTGLSVLYEEFYIKRGKPAMPVTNDHSE